MTDRAVVVHTGADLGPAGQALPCAPWGLPMGCTRRQAASNTLALPTLLATLWARPAMASVAPAPATPLVVRLGGSGTGLGVLQGLVDAYTTRYPDERFKVMPAWGNAGAFDAVRSGRLDLAVVNRPEPPWSGADARKLAVTWLARTPQVIAIHRSAGIDKITLEDLAAAYRNEIHRLPSGQRLRPVLRPRDSGTSLTVGSLAPSLAEALKLAQQRGGMLRADDEQEMLRLIDEVPGAFGAVTLAGMIASRLHLVALAIGDLQPTVPELEARRYPLQRQLYLVSHALPAPRLQGFASYTRTPEARSVLASLGCSTRLPGDRGALAPATRGVGS